MAAKNEGRKINKLPIYIIYPLSRKAMIFECETSSVCQKMPVSTKMTEHQLGVTETFIHLYIMTV